MMGNPKVKNTKDIIEECKKCDKIFNIDWPISKEMEFNNYIDVINSIDSIDKSTRPCYPDYQNEPEQRIDFIYIKGINPKI